MYVIGTYCIYSREGKKSNILHFLKSFYEYQSLYVSLFFKKEKKPLYFISILYTFYQFMYQVMQEFNILIWEVILLTEQYI